MSTDQRVDIESRIQKLVSHVWDREVDGPQIKAWADNFNGLAFDQDEEQLYALLALSRYMYFTKKLVREMLRSLYRDHFETVLLQEIRRNAGGTTDVARLRAMYGQELAATRFIGVGNPAESGAHLLYYFRQVNRLPKDLFADLAGVFDPEVDRLSGDVLYRIKDVNIRRLVFFDDLVGSATQASDYLGGHLQRLRRGNSSLDLRFMALFATTAGLEKMNSTSLFDGDAMCLFELDDSYKAFEPSSRYFLNLPQWFDTQKLYNLAFEYGKKLMPRSPLGYKNGQLLLSFTHNTPDNSLPIFWKEGLSVPWSPIFIRYDKQYQ